MAPIPDGATPVGWLEAQTQRVRHWVRAKLGIDKPIAFTILARAWASFAGLITVALIARFLTPAEQGYYYTFGSLVALQIIFELGFSFVILQMASHERAHLEIAADGTITGNPVGHSRLASVLQKAVRWYSVAALLLVGFLLAAGDYFFSKHEQAGVSIHWHLPWAAAAIAAAITFQVDPILSFMEGCGFVANVARVRLCQAATGSVLAWTSLALHHGLFAPSMVISGNALVALIWLSRHSKLLIPLLRHPTDGHRVHWMREVWPFQWRIAVSWLCGYFIYQLYNPVLFAYRGAVEAGRMGMSLNLANALQAVAIAWINTKAAPFGAMVARREFAELDRHFFAALKQSVGVCIAGAILVLGLVIWMSHLHFRLAQRLLDPLPLGILLLTIILNVSVFGEALYLRAHKQEKFLLNSVLAAVLMTASTFFLGRAYGAMGMVSGSLLIAVVVGLPLGTWTFVKYRREWHA